ncbi:hypothetical protein CAK78_14340 [Aeromonas sp. A35_P]|uniref:XRE family transcriptional regulator n=1 Tax=Aeromonas sp. A35_P TaxID=1983805 RepID=UPI000B9B4685|nr:S24 family peptidase [Aeromonas sp. A35_P]OZG41248.1 hypothetical protein CAK78_14340 [Aeromonas sp. A35_P]
MSDTYKETIEGEKSSRDQSFLMGQINRFGERLKKAMNGESNLAFAKKCGVSDTTIRKYLRGETYPDLDTLGAIAEVSGCSLAWLASGEERPSTEAGVAREGHQTCALTAVETRSIALPPHMDDFIMVNDLSTVEAAAGAGSYVAEEESSGRMAFRREWIEREGLNARALRIIRARGDSMEPTIQDGAPILVEAFTYADDDGNTRYLRNGRTPEEIVRQDGIYVIQLHGRLLVKRLQLDLLGGLLVKSDNQAYDTLHIQANQIEDIAVIGRVVWTGRKL